MNYIIFAGSSFYPSGGYKDFYGVANTFKDALVIYDEALSVGSKHTHDWFEDSFGLDSKNNPIYQKCGWAHIVNVKNNKIVVKSIY